MIGNPRLWAFIALLPFMATTFGFRCKWSNEGCQSGEECCSKSCVQSHPGTNPRCTKCSMHEDCLYSYHCESRLICGPKRKCCADYWETCALSSDCCDPKQKCISVKGFVYRKCLFGPVRYRGSSSSLHLKQYSLLTIPLLLNLAFLYLWIFEHFWLDFYYKNNTFYME